MIAASSMPGTYQTLITTLSFKHHYYLQFANEEIKVSVLRHSTHDMRVDKWGRLGFEPRLPDCRREFGGPAIAVFES